MYNLDVKALLSKLLGSQARHLLTLVAGFLVAKGILAPESVVTFVGIHVEIVVAITAYLITTVWGYFKSLKAQKVEDIATEVAPIATARITKK